jgi:hypothetical protein
MLNACKLFNPILYLINLDDCAPFQLNNWLDNLYDKFQVLNDECNRCRGECFKMVETIWETISNKFLWEAWDYANNIIEWLTIWFRLRKV